MSLIKLWSYEYYRVIERKEIDNNSKVIDR